MSKLSKFLSNLFRRACLFFFTPFVDGFLSTVPFVILVEFLIIFHLYLFYAGAAWLAHAYPYVFFFRLVEFFFINFFLFLELSFLLLWEVFFSALVLLLLFLSIFFDIHNIAYFKDLQYALYPLKFYIKEIYIYTAPIFNSAPIEKSLNFKIVACYTNLNYTVKLFFSNWFFFNNIPQIMLTSMFFLFIFSTIFSFFFYSYIGLYGLFVFNAATLLLLWGSASLNFPYYIFYERTNKLNLGSWIYLGYEKKIPFTILIDKISFSFSYLTISIMVFTYFYAFAYFRGEPNVERLLLFLNFFVISIILFFVSGNFIVMFLGWELIGISSFVLINFWVTRVGTLKAAFKAFVFNKFSDVCFFVFNIIIFQFFTSFEIDSFLVSVHTVSNTRVNFFFDASVSESLSFMILVCVFVKSAQFGAHVWLPDSMEAPVPASALIHSATLVSAGIFLIVRLYPLFEISEFTKLLLVITGPVTACYGGLVASAQSDLKKILAYSTISHCGFLVYLSAIGSLKYTLIYLYVHGFSKAGAFLCVGNIIRFAKGYQDFRRMGGFANYLHFEYFALGNFLFNLSGLPLSVGYFSKHLVFVSFFDNKIVNSTLSFFLIGAALSGLFYSYRLFYNVFFDHKKAKKHIYMQANINMHKSLYYTNGALSSTIMISLMVLFSYFIVSVLIYAFFFKFGVDATSTNYSSVNEFVNFNQSRFREFNAWFFNYLFFIIFILLVNFVGRRNFFTIRSFYTLYKFFFFFIFPFFYKYL